MSEYQFTPEALSDLLDIWNFIAHDNIEAADRVEAAVFLACNLLVKSPSAGVVRRDLTTLPVRFWVVHPYPNYLIVYDPEKRPLQIIRILHGARNLPSLLT
jgi:plasmid stabilization system protein ParE